MATTIQFRRDTAAVWASVNPVLATGEPGFETDTGKSKTGDGSTAWAQLGYDQGGAVDVPAASVAALPGKLDGRNTYNGVAFIQDNVTTHEGVQYAVWINEQGNPIIARRTLPSKVWEETYDLSLIAGNPLATPTALDGHNVYCLAVSGDGHIHVIGNLHDDPLRYVRTTVAAEIGAWQSQTIPGTAGKDWTYPGWLKLPGGRTALWMREGVSGDGDYWLMRYTPGSSGAFGTWETARKILSGSASNESPYPDQFIVSGTGKLGVFYNWRSSTGPGGSSAGSNNDVCYIESLNEGQTWQTIEGAARTLPITHAASPVVYDTVDFGSGLLNTNGACFDSQGRPHKAMFLYDEDGSTDIYHLHHDGTAWVVEQLTDFTYKVPTVGVGIIDERIGRPSIFAHEDKVLVLYRASVDGGGGILRCIDVSPGERLDPPHFPLCNIDLGGWEPSFDNRALCERGELHLLLTTIAFPLAQVPYYISDDPSYQHQWGGILSVDLEALPAFAAGRAFLPRIEPVQVAGLLEPQTVSNVIHGDLPLPRQLSDPLDSSLLLFGRLKVRGSATDGAATLWLSQETDENSPVTRDLGRMQFTEQQKRVKQTPWMPLAPLSGRSLLVKSRGWTFGQLAVDAASTEIGRLVDGTGVAVNAATAPPIPELGAAPPHDTFAGNDDTELSAHMPDDGGVWTLHPATASGAFGKLQGNRLRGGGVASAIYLHSWVPNSADQEVSGTLLYNGAGTGGVVGLQLRADPIANTCVLLQYSAATGVLSLFEIVDGVVTTLGSVTANYTAAKELRFKVVGALATVYVDDVEVLSGAVTIADAGRVGLRIGGNATIVISTLDNYQILGVAAGSTTPIDTFTGPDNQVLSSHVPDDGASWLAHPANAGAICRLEGNEMRGGSSTSAVYSHTRVPAGPDQRVECDLRIDTGGTGGRVGLQARSHPTINTSVLLQYDAATGVLSLIQLINGTATTLDSVTANYTSDKHLMLKVAGNEATAHVDDVETLSGTVTIVDAFTFGLRGQGTAATLNATMDNYQAESFTPIPEPADTFTGADNTTLASHTADDGGAWAAHPANAGATCKIAGGHFRGHSSTSAAYTHSWEPESADQWAEIDLIVGATGTGGRVAVQLRSHTSDNTCVLFQYDATTGILSLTDLVAGTATDIQTPITPSYAASTKRMRLEVEGTAARAYIDGVLTLSGTTTVAAANKVGVRGQGSAATLKATGDNYAAGDL